MTRKLLVLGVLVWSLAACGGPGDEANPDTGTITDTGSGDTGPGDGDTDPGDGDTGHDTGGGSGDAGDAGDTDSGISDTGDAGDTGPGDTDASEPDDATPNPEGVTASFVILGTPSTFDITRFDASASSATEDPELSFEWDFGDGATGEGVQVGHIYAQNGSYSVTLTVYTNDGRQGERVREVVVADPVATETGTLRIWAFDSDGSPLSGATVHLRNGPALAATDLRGKVEIEVGVGIPLVYTIQAEGFANQVVRAELAPGEELQNTETFLVPRQAPVFLLDAEAGGAVTGAFNSRIEFDADSLVFDDTGEPVTGPVAISITPLNYRGGTSAPSLAAIRR